MRDYLSKIIALKPYISIFLINLFILIIILMNAFTFFWYLYAPLGGNVIIHQVKKPLLDEVLLKSVLKEIDENSQNLSKKLQETHPDPFE